LTTCLEVAQNSSEKQQGAQTAVNLKHAKNDDLPDFDDVWHPTLWRAYKAFGPTREEPFGHGGFSVTAQ
jgi:hypothetical protein